MPLWQVHCTRYTRWCGPLGTPRVLNLTPQFLVVWSSRNTKGVKFNTTVFAVYIPVHVLLRESGQVIRWNVYYTSDGCFTFQKKTIMCRYLHTLNCCLTAIAQKYSVLCLWKNCERVLLLPIHLKVLDQITLENKFCLNFKIRSVFI